MTTMKQRLLFLLTALLASAPMWAKVGDVITRNGIKYEVKDAIYETVWVVGHEDWIYGDLVIPEQVPGMGNAVTGIGNGAFYECTSLTSVTIPYGVKEIRGWAFQGCTGLKSVSIPGSVESIGNLAFYGCTGLTSITFPEGMTTVGNTAFCGCTSLISVTIPSSMAHIYDAAFYGCTSVLDVYCYADPDNLNMPKNNGSFNWEDGTTKFHVDASQLDKFEASQWNNPENPDDYLNVTFVGDLNTPVLTDGEPYTRTVEKTVTSVTFKKTIGSEQVGKHQAWLVPFNYSITAADLAKFSFYKINMIANSPSPEVETTDDEAWVFLSKMKAGDRMYANMPYVCKPLAAVTDYQFITTNTPLKAPESEGVTDCSTTTDLYTFYATYLPTAPRSGFDYFYYVNDDGSISYVYGDDSGVTVSPYRWVVRRSSKAGGSSAYAREMHFVDGEGETTGISAPLNEKGEMRSDKWYTIDGRKLQGKPTQKGMYIVNGAKVVIK